MVDQRLIRLLVPSCAPQPSCASVTNCQSSFGKLAVTMPAGLATPTPVAPVGIDVAAGGTTIVRSEGLICAAVSRVWPSLPSSYGARLVSSVFHAAALELIVAIAIVHAPGGVGAGSGGGAAGPLGSGSVPMTGRAP